MKSTLSGASAILPALKAEAGAPPGRQREGRTVKLGVIMPARQLSDRGGIIMPVEAVEEEAELRRRKKLDDGAIGSNMGQKPLALHDGDVILVLVAAQLLQEIGTLLTDENAVAVEHNAGRLDAGRKILAEGAGK